MGLERGHQYVQHFLVQFFQTSITIQTPCTNHYITFDLNLYNIQLKLTRGSVASSADICSYSCYFFYTLVINYFQTFWVGLLCPIYRLALPLLSPETLSSLSKLRIFLFNAHLALFAQRMTQLRSLNSISKYHHLNLP